MLIEDFTRGYLWFQAGCEAMRPMGQMERFFAKTCPYGLGLIYNTLEIVGKKFTTRLMEDALEMLVKRYPALRMTVVKG